MSRVLQENMNRARRAGDLLEQIAREEDADILLLSEQSYNMNCDSNTNTGFPMTLATALNGSKVEPKRP